MSTNRRHRLEDLGRLAVLLDIILEDEMFDYLVMGHKSFPEWFWSLTIEEQQKTVQGVALGIQRAKESVSACLDIAEGHDNLNEVAADFGEEMKKFMQGFAYKPPKEEESEYEP